MIKSTLEKIYLSSLKFLAPLTPEETYATIVSEAMKLVRAEWGSIFIMQKVSLERIYASDPVLYKTKPRRKGHLYKAYKTGKPVVLRGDDIARVHPEFKRLSVVSNIIIPLSYRKKSIGLLTVLSKKEEKLTNEDLNTLILFGSMASLAIRKSQLYDETKKALESRDLFISMAAHELKTPVTTIYGYAQLLHEKLNGKRTEAEWVASLHSECSRLKFLINDLLEINRINTGRLQYYLKECSLKEIIRRAVDNFKFNYPDREVIVEDKIKDKGDSLICDFDRLMQVFINLLDNAAKFSPADTRIIFSVEEDKKSFLLQVRNQGKGVAEKDLKRVFERYYKGMGTSHEGLGLGLFLAKSIVEKHYGSISITSQLNSGTIVEVKLPKMKI